MIKTMKKTISILITVVMTLGMALCMSACSPKQGVISDIHTIYSNGGITREDVMDIAYYCSKGYVYVDEVNEDGESASIRIEDYIPIKKLKALSKKEQQRIVEAYYNERREEFERILQWYDDLTMEDIINEHISVEFYGQYNGFYAVGIETDYFESSIPEIGRYRVDDISWKYEKNRQLYIYFEI